MEGSEGGHNHSRQKHINGALCLNGCRIFLRDMNVWLGFVVLLLFCSGFFWSISDVGVWAEQWGRFSVGAEGIMRICANISPMPSPPQQVNISNHQSKGTNCHAGCCYLQRPDQLFQVFQNSSEVS